MGTKKKANVSKSRPIVKAKPDYLTDKQWELLQSDEVLFPKKLARANEMLAKIMESRNRRSH